MTQDEAVSLEVFKASMEQAVAAMLDRIAAHAGQHPEHREEILRMGASLVPVDQCEYAFFGSAMMEAMADALLAMPMTLWERFYRGYVVWSLSMPKRTYKGQEEENARGAMLMALKYRCEALQHQVERLDHAT